MGKRHSDKLSWTYELSGVDIRGEDEAFKRLLPLVRCTFFIRRGIGEPVIDIGYFASVVQITDALGIAICTDGVGTKLLVAQMLGKYDTIGIDCVAMNVNDLLCVGAEPIAFVDYIAVERLNPNVVEEIARGLCEGAHMAKVAIVGGELAQLGEMIRGADVGLGFDLAGTAIGVVKLDEIVIGRGLEIGDVIIGLPSSGIHSNGLTLARRIFFEHLGWDAKHHCDELGGSVGEALLTPTKIYVEPIVRLLRSGARVKALSHITGGGWLNMLRTATAACLRIDSLPEPQPIFKLIQKHGNVTDAEMYRTFNMGVGFSVIVAKQDVQRALDILSQAGESPTILGEVESVGRKMLKLIPLRLAYVDGSFVEL
ncbi:MAG: phosphoribosylformylglycinamidine cyclo-ligase [Armatimonadota bacterium]|nr:phosphoribosylformylglycinamidine cyclo-ligase [Armatimonadota bacterium]MCX7777624.1 phosphoribosylformylglycinamidine cyclo-ligase [Armatimonadota bacterium]MDW8024697.1 phosphoribosylformylglycinamidine cyclo-ligase [Armatimonadota bacterium]